VSTFAGDTSMSVRANTFGACVSIGHDNGSAGLKLWMTGDVLTYVARFSTCSGLPKKKTRRRTIGPPQ